MSQLVYRNNPEVILLPFGYLLLHFLLQVFSLLTLLDAINVLRISSHVLQQHSIKFALFCSFADRDVALSDHFLIGLGRSHVLANKGGDFENAVLAGDATHAGFNEKQQTRLTRIAIVVPAEQPTPQEGLHASPQIVLLEDLHLLRVLRLRDVSGGHNQDQSCQQQSSGYCAHPSIIQQMSEDRARSLPRNSSQETRIKLLSGFQESYLEDKRSDDDFPLHPQDEEENLQEKFLRETCEALKEEVRQTELLIEYEKSVKSFLLQKLGTVSKGTANKKNEVVEVTSEYLSSAVKYVEDLVCLQDELTD